MEFRKGEEVVFCPVDNTSEYRSNRGADGVVTDRQTTKNGKRVRLKSFLVKWRTFRKGVSFFRVRGKKQRRSDYFTALFEKRASDLKKEINMGDGKVSRFEENVKHVHPISYCRNCPLRLRRMLTPCYLSKAEAIKQYGEVKEKEE